MKPLSLFSPVAILILLQPSAAAQAPRPLALEDYYRVESAAAAAISPDGRLVAAVRSYIDEDANQRRSEIWLAPSDGSAPARRITDPAFNASGPRWSSDGKLLAFSSRRPGAESAGNVWFLRMDQPGEAFQIPGVEGTPLFSPDNQWIAFTKTTPPGERPRPAYGSDAERKIHERFKGRMYDWMGYRFDQRGYLPDPRDPYATPPEELYVVPRAGGAEAPRQLTRLGVNVRDATWRPDAKALAFVTDTHERDEYTYERADLWVVDLGGEPRRVTGDDGYDHSSPAWTPDGRALVFRREKALDMVIASRQDHGAPLDVFRMPAEGGPMRNLTEAWDLLPGPPTVSPDGSVYMSGGIGGSSHLFRIAPSGDVRQVTSGERQLGGFTYSAAFDRMAYTAADATHPAEAFTAPLGGEARGGKGEANVTGFSQALLATLQLNPPERITYRSKDGTEIEGWLILSPAPRTVPSPLILAIHGGPHGAYGNDFSFQFQLWAANGYAVLYTNPRGSTGYGEKFLWATWGGGWGNSDMEDVLGGVDYVVSRYPVDPKRFAVTGYSYGGFLTDWIITHDTRFAAAVTGAGISNWVSDYGTADIPRTKESEFFGAPWEHGSAQLLLRQSPIMYAGAVTTPTLFVHGESDLRVPIEQAEQLYTALKKRKVPAMFVRYPDTYHGGWTPWNTAHRYYQELQWWSKWLGGKATLPAQLDVGR